MSTSAKILVGSVISAFLLLSYATAQAQGTGTIGQLDQWRATTSPTTSITQNVFGRTIRLTGLSDGCLGLTSGLITSNGVVCGSGSGGAGTVSTSSAETATYVPVWTSTNGSPATLSGGSAGFAWDSALARLTATNASTTALTVGTTAYMPGTGIWNSSGNVGVGTLSPNALLHLSGSDSGTTLTAASAARLTIANSNTTNNNFSEIGLAGTDTNGAVVDVCKIAGVTTAHTPSAMTGDLVILCRNSGTLSEKVRVTAAGNVGIGTTTPANKVDLVAGALASTQNALNLTGTLSATNAVQTGVNIAITSGAGSGTTDNQNGLAASLTAGYTGSALTTGATFTNLVAGTGNDFTSAANYNAGLFGQARGTTVGDNIGVQGIGRGGNFSIGMSGKSVVAKSGAINIGNASYAANSSGTAIGGYFFLGATKLTVASTSAALIADNGSAVAPIFLANDNTTEVFRIADGGNVGVGTTTPDTKLTVAVSGVNGINLDRDTSNGSISSRLFLSTNNGNNTIRSVSGDLMFASGGVLNSTSGTTRMVITSAGNVGIGTTTPDSKLSVSGTSGSATPIFTVSSSTAASLFSIGSTGATSFNNQPGTSGQVLQSFGSSAPPEWVATSSLGIGGSGTVTSIAMTVPTGLSISGSPITTSGTLALSLTSGYNIPLTASTTNWNTFYDTPSNRITDGTGLTWSGNTLNVDNSQNIGTLSNLTSNGLVTTSGGTGALSITSTLPVANGGTGTTSLTAYAPIFGGTTSTGAVQSGTVGTTGQVLTSNGAGALPTFQAAPSSASSTVKFYTAGDTWNKPAGLRYIVAEVQGSGGGSGGCTTAQAAAAGAGAGGYTRELIPAAALGSTETVTIGTGGAAGSDVGGAGGSGTATSFGSHLSANSGGGSAGCATTAASATVGAGGTASGGDINLTGEPGSRPSIGGSGTNQNTGGEGGDPHMLGYGGQEAATNGNAPINGFSGYLGGGSSGSANGSGTGDNFGLIGATGYVLITEYY